MNKDSLQNINYKKLMIPAALVLSSVIILLFIILPQISSISDQLLIIKNQQEEVSTLKASLNVLTGQPNTELDTGFATSIHALPTGKDIALIFSVLSESATATNIILKEFSLTIGGVHGRAAKLDSGATLPKVNVTASIGGTERRDFVSFASELQKRLPLSELSRLDMSEDSATVEIAFFYKPYDITQTKKLDKILPLSQADLNLLNKLREWEK